MNTNTLVRTEKKQSHIIIELIECHPDARLSTTVIKKSDDDVDMTTFRTFEEDDENTLLEASIFDKYAMVLEGHVFVKINGVSTMIPAGEGKVLPAFDSYYLDPRHPFKVMLTTVIKGGY